MNLNLFIAKSGFCSRRKAGALIKEGRVSVNGKVVVEPWFKVEKDDRVKVDNRPLSLEKNIYIVLNKPEGVTTTVEDRFADKKIVDSIPKSMGRVYPVGRLDKPSRGLVILTNDGDLCYRLTHPKFEVEKEYIVSVEGEVGQGIVEKLKKGVEETGDLLRVKAAYIEKSGLKSSVMRVVVCEGKKRQIRRLFEGLGFTVLDLQRTRIGGLELGDLKEGRFKVLDRETIYKLTLNQQC